MVGPSSLNPLQVFGDRRDYTPDIAALPAVVQAIETLQKLLCDHATRDTAHTVNGHDRCILESVALAIRTSSLWSARNGEMTR
jgi:hypothetical protein